MLDDCAGTRVKSCGYGKSGCLGEIAKASSDGVRRHPGAVPLDQYEHTLDDFISHYCHRRLADRWAMDKTVRDAGPFVASLANGAWTGNERATHMPVLIWYSPKWSTG